MLIAAKRFAYLCGVEIVNRLGFGQDGTVFGTAPPSAIEVFVDRPRFFRELAAYQRLHAHGISAVRGHNVPLLLGWDEELLAIQMTIVAPPFLLDFAGARLDRPFEFGPVALEEWRAEKQEMFGARWREVRLVMSFMEGLGIYLHDIHPGNIRFGDEPA